MTRRLLVSYLSITFLVLAMLVLPLGFTFASHETDVLLAGIERDAHSVSSLVEDDLEAGIRPSVDGVLADYASGGGRIVVADNRGLSVADSERIGGAPRDFSTRPEIRDALAGSRAEGVRWSDTLGHNLMYVAIPVTSGGVVHGAVRISYPMTELDSRVRQYWLRLGLLSAGTLVMVAAVGFLLARGVTRPVRDLRRVTERLSTGQLDARASTRSGAPELRSLGETVNLMADRLQRLVDSQRVFVADAAHQLRTPLTALRLRLEMLDRGLPAPQRDRLDAALAEASRLGRLVDSLLVLARADAAEPQLAAVDLSEVVTERVDAWTPVALERDVHLEVRVQPCPPAWAVTGSVEQMLDNLLSNAITASPEGGTVTVSVAPETSGTAAGTAEGTAAGTATGEVVLRVVDQGPGLTEEERARAFERFWRAKDARSGGGFGLGLAITRRLAELAGGSVTLVPAPHGSGLQAIVRLRTRGGER
ncbi:signal transduction histidine kinase [Saccharomonospora amisosensis]|uniref:histidine kinase n=1 Tax=Saccharomonospora amisosensis TaxID=1128677 RepID=A0A7X5ZR67_9PSEU|nr:ATP-binding protein [Saccharomonospora amisosensis]NIJ12522.1 signal transduction histidine kinase [Saccharomonospora amisosensis]